MCNIIKGQTTLLENENFEWLIGRSIEDIRFAEPESWWISLTGGGVLATHGGTWRIISINSMVVCSQDHGHQFGHPTPLDAIDIAQSAIRDAKVKEVRIRKGVPDLLLSLDNDLILEVLALSNGYECWEIRDPQGRCLVVHGSRDAQTWQDSG